MKINAALSMWKIGQNEVKNEKEKNKCLNRKIWQCEDKIRELKVSSGVGKKKTGLKPVQNERVRRYK